MYPDTESDITQGTTKQVQSAQTYLYILVAEVAAEEVLSTSGEMMGITGRIWMYSMSWL